MKNKFTLIIIAVVVLAITGFFILKQINFPLKSAPANFNLIFRYGIGAKNELNTFSQTYTKDMIMDPLVTVDFKLTDKELEDIYQKMNDLKLFDKKEEPAKENMDVTPCSSYYLKIQSGSDQKELSWSDCYGKISDKLQQFTDYIIKIIESKEEYKALPKSKGGYL